MEESKESKHLKFLEKNESPSISQTVDLKFSVPWGHIAGIIIAINNKYSIEILARAPTLQKNVLTTSSHTINNQTEEECSFMMS
jgi:hypothetical protein